MMRLISLLLYFAFSACFQFQLAGAAPPSNSGKTNPKPAAGTTGSAAKTPAPGTAKKLPKVLDFSAVWCGPCKKFAPVFDKVAQTYKGKVDFVHYDVETGPGKPLADKYNINTVPTVMFLDAAGKTVYRVGELMKEEDLVKHTEELLK